jgi:hypothetical protein
LSNFDQISGMDELMQMAVIELVRKEAKTEGGHRVSFEHLCDSRAGKVDPMHLRAPQLGLARRQVRGRDELDHSHSEPCCCQG